MLSERSQTQKNANCMISIIKVQEQTKWMCDMIWYEMNVCAHFGIIQSAIPLRIVYVLIRALIKHLKNQLTEKY